MLGGATVAVGDLKMDWFCEEERTLGPLLLQLKIAPATCCISGAAAAVAVFAERTVEAYRSLRLRDSAQPMQ